MASPDMVQAKDMIDEATEGKNVSANDHVAAALGIIRESIVGHSPERISISFNGGKDSVVVMELLKRAVGLEVMREWRLFILDEADEFPELIEFREEYLRTQCPGIRVYHFTVQRTMRETMWAVQQALAVEVVFMGTRRTDPSGRYQQSSVEPTTAGWPAMLRVCPIFDWSFSQIWSFHTNEGIAFCKLYREGFTSLGKRSCTHQNEQLRCEDGTFSPAWTLKAGTSERDGRA